MTAMKEAFRKAGYESPFDRFEAILAEAVRSHLKVADQIAMVEREIKDDAQMLWSVVFRKFRDDVIREHLRKAAEKLLNEREADHRKPSVDRPRLVPSVSAGGHRYDEHRVPVAASSGAARSASIAERPMPRYNPPLLPPTVTAARVSRLQSFRVNGQPFGEVTNGEALEAATGKDRDCRFIRLVCRNQPRDRLVKETVHDPYDDLDRLYAIADAEARKEAA